MCKVVRKLLIIECGMIIYLWGVVKGLLCFMMSRLLWEMEIRFR